MTQRQRMMNELYQSESFDAFNDPEQRPFEQFLWEKIKLTMVEA